MGSFDILIYANLKKFKRFGQLENKVWSKQTVTNQNSQQKLLWLTSFPLGQSFNFWVFNAPFCDFFLLSAEHPLSHHHPFLSLLRIPDTSPNTFSISLYFSMTIFKQIFEIYNLQTQFYHFFISYHLFNYHLSFQFDFAYAYCHGLFSENWKL